MHEEALLFRELNPEVGDSVGEFLVVYFAWLAATEV